MAKSEYMVVPFNARDEDGSVWESALNAAAANDWELVSTVSRRDGAAYAIMRRDPRPQGGVTPPIDPAALRDAQP